MNIATWIANLLGRRDNVEHRQISRVETFVGIVVGQTSGATTFGPASAMSYKVGINFPDGYRELDGIKPVMDRWPDAQNVVPIKPNTVVLVGSVDGFLQLMARELPHVVDCVQLGTSPLTELELRLRNPHEAPPPSIAPPGGDT